MHTTRVKILYVEDDRIDQLAFEQFVRKEKLPYELRMAGSVHEAKKILAEEQFNLVITDYSLGDGNAFDVFESVTNKAPIVFVTSANDLTLAVTAMRSGAYDYLVKDLERNYLGMLPHVVKKAMAHRKADEALVHARQQLEESLKIKEQFLANISHEIRTPLNGIIGFIHLLEGSDLSGEQDQYVQAIRRSGENLLVIINDILDFSRNRAGKVNFEKINFSLPQVLRSVEDLLKQRAEEKGIQYSTGLKDVPEYLRGDPTRLTQVLLNLVGNAIKFTEKGLVRVSVKRTAGPDDQVRLEFCVSDTGIGIPSDKLENIFDVFVQAASDTTRKYGGSGLGLAIVKQLVEMQGGAISVKSKVGTGSEFTFTLSFGKGEKPAGKEETPTPVAEEPQLEPGTKVLLVEDNMLNQLLAEKHLSNWKCKVIMAEDGLLAVRKLEEEEVDIVLMDLQLPGMDGYQATRWIRNKIQGPKSRVPIIAVTAHATLGDQEKCFAAGMNGYMVKPFDWKKLKQAMVKLIKKPLSINMDFVKEILGDDDDFIAMMMNKYVKDSASEMQKLKIAIDEKDWPQVRMLSHKMLGSSRVFGIEELNALLAGMEDQAKSGQAPEKILPLYADAVPVFERVIAALQEELGKIKK